MVSVEENWEQRLQQEKDRLFEDGEWRVAKLQEAYRNKRNKRARMEQDVELGTTTSSVLIIFIWFTK